MNKDLYGENSKTLMKHLKKFEKIGFIYEF